MSNLFTNMSETSYENNTCGSQMLSKVDEPAGTDIDASCDPDLRNLVNENNEASMISAARVQGCNGDETHWT